MAVWTASSDLYTISEEPELGSSIFRRASLRRRTSPYSQTMGRVPGSMKREPLGGSLERGAHLDPSYCLTLSRREEVMANRESERKVDPGVLCAANDLLRHPVAAQDMAFTRRDLRGHVRKALNIRYVTKDRLSKQRQHVRQLLNVSVFTSEGLEFSAPRDKKPNPYCILSIGRSCPVLAEEVEEDIGSTFVEFVARTKVCDGTQSPAWNDSFQFDLTDYGEEICDLALYCYVWSFSDRQRLSNDRTGLNEMADVHHISHAIDEPLTSEDDFLGRVRIPLKDMLSFFTPTDCTFPLYDQHYTRHNLGAISLSLSLRQSRPFRRIGQNCLQGRSRRLVCRAFMEELWLHQAELSAKIQTEVDNSLSSAFDKRWFEDSLEPRSWLVLTQFAAQWKLSPLDLAAVCVEVVAKSHTSNDWDAPLPITAALRSLQNLQLFWSKEKNGGLSDEVLNDLFSSLETLHEVIVDYLTANEGVFPPQVAENLEEVSYHLRCLELISHLQLWKERSPSPMSADREVKIILKDAVEKWYRGDEPVPSSMATMAIEELLFLVSGLQDIWRESTDVCMNIMAASQYDSTFNICHVKYSNFTTDVLITMMGEDITTVLYAIGPVLSQADNEASVQNLALQTFVVFMIVNYLAKKAHPLLKRSLNDNFMVQHYKWFDRCVPHWLSAIDSQKRLQVEDVVRAQVHKAGLGWMSTQIPEDGYSEYSVQINELIAEVTTTYWKPLLSWPQPVTQFTTSVRIVDVVCNIARQYIFGLLKYIEGKRFIWRYEGELTLSRVVSTGKQPNGLPATRACEYLCDVDHVLTNGVYRHLRIGTPVTVSQAVPLTPLSPLAAISVDLQQQEVLSRVLESLRDDTNMRLDSTVQSLLEEFRLTIVNDIQEMMKTKHTASIDLAAQVAQPLVLHSSKVLSQLICQNVPRSIFNRFLQQLWKMIVDEAYRALKAKLSKRMSREHCQLVFEALQFLATFFQGNNKKLDFNTPHYQALVGGLDMARKSTEQLIFTFYGRDVDAQLKANEGLADMGSIRLRVELLHQKSRLFLSITVADCTGVAPLEKVGSGDVCLRVELCPKHAFESPHMFTESVRGEPNLTINSTILFPVPDAQSAAMQQGVILLTFVHRHWWGLWETSIGQVVTPLHSIPRPIPGGPDLLQPGERLITCHVTPATSHDDIIRVLQTRASWDKLAAEFIVQQRKRMQRPNRKSSGSDSPHQNHEPLSIF